MHLCLTLKINTYNKCKPLKFAPHTKEIKSKLNLFEEELLQLLRVNNMANKLQVINVNSCFVLLLIKWHHHSRYHLLCGIVSKLVYILCF